MIANQETNFEQISRETTLEKFKEHLRTIRYVLVHLLLMYSIHELGHFIAFLSFGYKISDLIIFVDSTINLRILFPFLPGISRFQLILIYSAGILFQVIFSIVMFLWNRLSSKKSIELFTSIQYTSQFWYILIYCFIDLLIFHNGDFYGLQLLFQGGV